MTGATARAVAAGGRATVDGTEGGTAGARWAGRRRRLGRVMLATATVVGLAASLTACHTQRWHSQLVSANAVGTDSGNGQSSNPRIAADGTKVVFESEASDLGPTDSNGVKDIYLRDLTTGVTELVSVNAAGTDSGNARSYLPRLSADGSAVAFFSDATDLAAPAPGPAAQVQQAYVRDLVTGTTTLVSVSADGTTGVDGDLWSLELSPDGSRAVFSSDAGNLPPPHVPGVYVLYERDLAAGVTTRVAPGTGPTYSPSGDALAFYDGSDLYVRDAQTGTVSLVARGPVGTHLRMAPVFSHDGSRIAFVREPFTGTVLSDIYVYDRVARTTSLVTTAVTGSGGSNGSLSAIHGFHPTDANRLLFSSSATNLVPNDTNRRRDIFVRHLRQRTTTRVVSGAGVTVPHDPSLARWTANGTAIAFVSDMGDYGVTDTNTRADVYLLRLAEGTYELVSESGAGHDGGNRESGVYRPSPQDSFGSNAISASEDGTRIVYGSDANDLGPVDSDRDGNHDIYVATLGPAGP
jgi:Tol biopolymer transport system component